MLLGACVEKLFSCIINGRQALEKWKCQTGIAYFTEWDRVPRRVAGSYIPSMVFSAAACYLLEMDMDQARWAASKRMGSFLCNCSRGFYGSFFGILLYICRSESMGSEALV